MRCIALLLAVAPLASCMTEPPPAAPNAQAQLQLERMLAGKTPGRPISCLPSYGNNDMQIIDGRTVAFRVGMRTLYLMHLSPGCELLGSGNYALLTKEFGGMGTCRGDIARVLDPSSRMTVGSCGVEEIVPYTSRDRS